MRTSPNRDRGKQAVSSSIQGVGLLLQNGVREISKHFPGSEDFAMQVKGLEMPAYHPNAAKGIGLSYAVSDRGGCHLRGSPLAEILGGADPLATEGKAALFKTNRFDTSIIDALILCYFVKFGITLKEIFQMVNPCTGFEYKSPRDLESVGERITAWQGFSAQGKASRPRMICCRNSHSQNRSLPDRQRGMSWSLRNSERNTTAS